VRNSQNGQNLQKSLEKAKEKLYNKKDHKKYFFEKIIFREDAYEKDLQQNRIEPRH
jgi:hypothetical protein